MSIARAADAAQPGGWTVRVLGFTVSIPWNALLGVAIIAFLWYPEFSASAGTVGQWVLAGVFAVLLMVSILVHELAHAAVARGLGYPVTGITLWAMGGFTTYGTDRRHGPGREAAIAAAGPVATLAIAGAAAFAAGAAPAGIPRDLLAALAWANALVGIFNLLPGSPLDGGAVVKSAVWAVTGSANTGQVVAAWVGRGLAALILVSPFLLALSTGTRPSLVLLVVAVMLAALLWSGASNSLKAASSQTRLGSIRATDVARPVDTIQDSANVSEAIGMMRPQRHLLVLSESGAPRAVVTPAAALAVPAEHRGRVSVLTVSAALGDVPAVGTAASALDVVTTCQTYRSRFVFVVDPAGTSAPLLVDTDDEFVLEGP